MADTAADHLGERTLVGDGLPSHRSGLMKAYLPKDRRWLVVEPLPGYVPDLNPVEAFWGNRKSGEPANLCVDTIEETDTTHTVVLPVIDDTELAFAFLRHAGLCRQRRRSGCRGEWSGSIPGSRVQGQGPGSRC